MLSIQSIARWVKSYIFHKSFFLGFFIAIGILSQYIFGTDNLAEEIAELFIYEKTGIPIDFTPGSKENIEKDLKEIVELSSKYRRHH